MSNSAIIYTHRKKRLATDAPTEKGEPPIANLRYIKKLRRNLLYKFSDVGEGFKLFQALRRGIDSQPLQQQQNTSTIARMITHVQLSSKRWHKQLLFIIVPPWSNF